MFCECGCGKAVNQNKRFIVGHNLYSFQHKGRGFKKGYIIIKNPNHPRKNKWGWVKEEILITEKALQKFLPLKAVIHHINHIKADNCSENLIICQNQSYHRIIHLREKNYFICGHASWKKCTKCHQYDEVKKLLKYKNGSYFHVKNCSVERKQQAFKEDIE